MPHHGFFAVRSDVRPLFEFVFASTNCQVFESYSVPDCHLRRFGSVDEVVQAAEDAPYNLGLRLYAPEMLGRYSIDRINLNPGAIPGKTWREQVQGWGLIQFELNFSATGNGCLHESFTNHNGLARAVGWSDTRPELPSVHEWDFKMVASISGKINRHLARKLAVRRIGSCSVLPGAEAASNDGRILLPQPVSIRSR